MEEQTKPKGLDSFLDQIGNLVYSPGKKIERYLLGLFFIGVIFRLLAALNLGVLADDMNYAFQSAGVIHSKIISAHSFPVSYLYLNDLAYHLLGYTTLASRFFPFLMGALCIITIFLITLKLSNDKKIAFYAAIFVTFSNFLIRMTFTEASLVVLFLISLAIYFGLVFLETRKTLPLVISGIFFGTSFLMKYSAPFFILAYLLFSATYLKRRKEKVFSQKNIKLLLLFFLIILIFIIPILSFNYFIYKEKGILDVYFSRIIPTENSKQLYSGLLGQGDSMVKKIFTSSIWVNYKLLYLTDPVLLIFGLFGMFFLYKSKKNIPFYFTLFLFGVPFILQSIGSYLPKHFMFVPFFFSIPAAYGLDYLIKRFKKIDKRLILAMLIILLILSMGLVFGTPRHLFDKSGTSQLKSFINGNIGQNDLIVFDSRIYTSRTFWLATPHHFLNLFQFLQFYQANSNLSQNSLVPTKVYFVECARDDCGWGTISNQPDLNQTAENLFSQISNISEKQTSLDSTVFEGNELFGKKSKQTEYIVYETTLNLNPSFVDQTDKVQSFYFVPYMYKDLSKYVFNYSLEGFLQKALQNISHLLIFFSLFSSIAGVLLAFYLLIVKNTF